MPFLRLFLIILLALPVSSALGRQERVDIDPWESVNRSIFGFNETLDRYLLRPVARGYKWVMPEFAQRGVTNFIANIYEFNFAYNSLLQGRPDGAAHGTARLLINTTVGVVGLFDVATLMGIERRYTDFGQTLAVWGVDKGPFIMLPVFGPRTVRSGVGYFVDTYTSIPALIENREAAYLFWTVEVIDYRARLSKVDDLITGDRYIFIRDAYLQSRETFLNGGVVEDSFSEFEEGDDWEDF